MRLFVYIFTLLITTTVFAEPPGNQSATLVSRGIAACVRVDSAADLSSGVIISTDGYVLTVAHGLASDEAMVSITLSGGESYKAKVVFQNPVSDVALLKIVRPSEKTFDAIPLASGKITEGTVVLAFGHPARDRTVGSAVVRLGNVVSTNAKTIRSTCVLTAGDSGGPLVTADGLLVGINQRIGASRTTNLHLNIAACCTALNDTLQLRQLPHAEPIGTVIVPPLSELMKSAWKNRAVEILDSQQQVVAWGTVMNSRTVVTKLSLLKPKTALQVRTFGGGSQQCKLIAQRRSNDIAVLRLPKTIDVDSINATKATAPRVGSLVYGTKSGEPGIVSRVAHMEHGGRPRLGCTLAVVGNSFVVEQVSADSAASDAGLKPGDTLLQLGHQQTTQLSDVGRVIDTLHPGDWIPFRVRRADEEHELFGQLRHSPAELLKRTEFLDGRSGELSLRRGSFAVTVQHDLPLTAVQMGGPLLTANGQVIGINIARRAREAVLAVPIQDVIATCPEIAE